MGRLGVPLVLMCALCAGPARAEGQSLWTQARQELFRIWNEGGHDIYLPFHTHHLRFAYDREKIERYQENPLGLGYGRSLEQNGVWRGVYFMGFQDSHFKPSYMLGYGRQWLWQAGEHWRAGGGLTVFLMTRADIGHYTPFPGILPTATLGWRNLSLEATYVPGSRGAGNLLFFWGRIELDRK